jgi:hypothetical protein
MFGESNMFLWISAGLCFIIITVISIFNFFRITNLEVETDNLEISLRNETSSNMKYLMNVDNSNVKVELDELKTSLESNINSNVNHIINSQKIIDSNQNVLIDKNELDIFNIGSNITHTIEPQMLVFDGQFKSLQSDIEGNDTELTQLSSQVSSQLILNDQFSNQNDNLEKQLKSIIDKDFGKKIADLRQDLVTDIDFNKQSIANLSVSLDDKYQSLSNMDYTLLQSNIETNSNLNNIVVASHGLAQVVDKLV